MLPNDEIARPTEDVGVPKLHWSQLPENKERFRAMRLKGEATKRKRRQKQQQGKGTKKSRALVKHVRARVVKPEETTHTQEAHAEAFGIKDIAIAYSQGKIDEYLAGHEARTGRTHPLLAFRVSELLQAGSRGAVLGAAGRVPKVRKGRAS